MGALNQYLIQREEIKQIRGMLHLLRTSEQILMQKIKIKTKTKLNLNNNNNNKKNFQKYNKRNEIIIMENQSANNRRCGDSLDEIIKIELNEI